MKRTMTIAMALGLMMILGTACSQAEANVITGKKAPEFSLKDSDGKTRSLKEFKGQYVVLEWVNYDCPFVKRQYNLNAMQDAQKALTSKGVAWLSINSSATGKQGHFSSSDLKARIKSEGAKPAAYLLDTDGKVGKLYGAKTTPHMFVIDPKGNLIYQGAIDDNKTASDSKPLGKNYVTAAITEAMAGKAISVSSTKPYGCSVKY